MIILISYVTKIVRKEYYKLLEIKSLKGPETMLTYWYIKICYSGDDPLV